MKKTYKLIGLLLDNLESSSNIKIYDNSFNTKKNLNTSEDKELLIMNSSKLLKINSDEDLRNILNQMKLFKNIIINIDYIPYNNIILRNFYKKRISQIYTLIKKETNSIVYISKNYNLI